MLSFKKLFNWLNRFSISAEELLRVFGDFEDPSLPLLIIENHNVGYIENIDYDRSANELFIVVKFADNVDCLFFSRFSILNIEKILKNHLSANVKIQCNGTMYHPKEYGNSHINRKDKKIFCNLLCVEKI